MRIAIGSDHRGTTTVKLLADKLRHAGHSVNVLFDCAGQSCDYPEPAYAVGKAIAEGRADRGILICGTGIGVSIAANKVQGVRAAVAHDELTAQLSRSHNDANIICLSADLLGERLIEKLVDTFIATEFSGGRHNRRIHKITAIEQGRDPALVVE